MTIKDSIKKEKLVPDELFEEFYEAFGHIAKLSTLRILAQDFLKRKEKERHFNIHKFEKYFKIKYPSISELFAKQDLKTFLIKLDKNREVHDSEAEQMIQNHEKINETIIEKLFNEKEYGVYFKKNDLYQELLESLKKVNLVEKNKLIEDIRDVLKKEEPIFKIKYLEMKKRLDEIIKPEDIETHYPLARRMKRTIHSFLGPTNSGKTHNAINRLKEASSGIYLAPLRLLAREIYDDLIASGVKASLITGEEKIIDVEAKHVCATMEMLNTENEYEVAIIDEIQFLADKDRGNAWSKALIGVAAKEIMVVGSTDAKFLIETIAEKCKDLTFFHEFTRLAPLEIIPHEIDVENLKEGDAIIAFSRKDVHSIAKTLETKYNKKVSMIYGALPPEVRLEESRRFNEGETDILVATDAIGFGLNLSINRIIFSTLEKFDGEEMEVIQQTVFNQISGRAGRYKKFDQGYVGFTDSFLQNKKNSNKGNFQKLAKKLYNQLPSLEQAYYFPEWNALNKLAEEIKEQNSLEKLLFNYHSLFVDRNEIFKFTYQFLERTLFHLDSIENVSLETKFKLVFAPVREQNMYFFEKCVDSVVKNEIYKSALRGQFDRARTLLEVEEVSHNALLYMWMNQRYPEIFIDYEDAKQVYSEISYVIMDAFKEGF